MSYKLDSVEPDSFEVLIEDPKGEGRRIHLSYSRTYYVDLGSIKKVIPVNAGIIPIAYGFVIGTLIKDEEETSELDAIVYSTKSYKIGDRTAAHPIAYLHLENGDHKVVFADDSVKIKSWDDIPDTEKDLILKYFGYKSRIKNIGNKNDALNLIKRCITKKSLPIPKEVIIRKE